MKRTILLSLLLFSLALAIYSTPAYAGLLGGQFAVPIESGATCGGQGCDSMINTYFGYVTNVADSGSLIKTGFYLTLLIAFIKFAFPGDKKWKTIVAIGSYLGTIVLIAWPVFGGKCLPMWVADATDYMTQSIITSMGGLVAKGAGAGVEFVMATGKAMNSAYQQQQYPLADFKEHCYNVVAAQDKQNGITVPKASQMTFDPNLTIPGATQTCTSLQAQLETDLSSSAQSYFTNDMNALKSPTSGAPIDTSKIQNAITQETSFYNSTAGQQSLLDVGTIESPTRTQLDKSQGWVSGLNELSDSVSLRSTLLYKPREMIIMIGQTALWVFDYYIFLIVSIIKTFAAMGMAFALLYFIFLQDLSPMVATAGFWMFGNAMYIVATLAQNLFYNRINTNLLTGAQTVLGLKSSINDDLFALAFIGVMATTLAGILTWKAVGGINMYFMGHQSGPSAFAGKVF